MYILFLSVGTFWDRTTTTVMESVKLKTYDGATVGRHVRLVDCVLNTFSPTFQ